MSAILQKLEDTNHNETSIWADWLDASIIKMLSEHPLMVALEKGEASPSLVKSLLAQHSHYSKHFTRYLCALISQMKDPLDVVALIDNMVEEMGVDGEDRVTHAELFQRSLRCVGVSPGDTPPLQATLDMVNTMLKRCQDPDSIVGLSALCLGAEAIVPTIYKPILSALEHLNYGPDATEFFRLHIEDDEDHALVMLGIMNRLIDGSPFKVEKAKQVGLELIQKRLAMFDAVWRNHLHEESETLTPQQSYSSNDFWQVPGQLTAHIPEKLTHKQVINSSSTNDENFSNKRNHPVHTVNLPSKTISMTIGRLTPGGSTRLHRHNYETIIYVMSGSGHSKIGSEIVPWEAGDAFYVPVWAEHQHINSASEECVYIACENAPLLQNLGGIALREEL